MIKKREGVLVTGPNGNRIFLIANGIWKEKYLNREEKCYYWSSQEADDQRAKALNLFEVEGIKNVGSPIYPIDKCYGLSIRPVISPKDVRNEEKKKEACALFWGNMYPSNEDTVLFDTFPEIDGWDIKKFVSRIHILLLHLIPGPPKNLRSEFRIYVINTSQMPF